MPKRQGAAELRPTSTSAVRLRDPVAKSRHIEVCLNELVEYERSAGFDAFEFDNQALPELALADIELGVDLGGKRLQAPLMIAPMTGGTEQGFAINRVLASAAQRFGLAMGVGSQRLALERADAAAWFQVRDIAPDILLFANLGAGQLARGWGSTQARQAVEMIGANALFVHFNAVQKAIQGGDLDFRGLAVRLRDLCRDLAFCARTARRRALGMRFGEWGIPTARSILNVRAASSGITLIASGGLRSGIDLAKAIALGADLGAMARPMLVRAMQGAAALHEFIEDVLTELRICMFAAGAGSVAALRGRAHPVGADV